MNEFKNYNDYCDGFVSENLEDVERSFLLLYLRDNINKLIELDVLNGEALPIGLINLYKKAAAPGFNVINSDLLTHVIWNFHDSFSQIVKNMREKIVRENVVMPVSKAKEINNAGINWLSRKPGDTIKQKLSGGYKMMAVNRRVSFDTGENRLFIALLREIEKFLLQKFNSIPEDKISEEEKKFYDDILFVLRKGFTNEIGKWENSAPNNTLLSDRYYRRAWNTWLTLHKMDDIVEADSENLTNNIQSIFIIKLITFLAEYCRFPQVPVLIDYNEFKINFYQNEINFVICNSHKKNIVSLKEINIKWHTRETGDFCFLVVNGFGEVFIHQKNFINQSDFSHSCDIIQFEIEEHYKNKGKYIVVLSKHIPFITTRISILSNSVSIVNDRINLIVTFNDRFVQALVNNKIVKDIHLTVDNVFSFTREIASIILEIQKPSCLSNSSQAINKGILGVIDIHSLRPKYFIDDENTLRFPTKLLCANFDVNEEKIQLPIGDANVLDIGLPTEIISVKSIFSSATTENVSIFAKQISESLDVEKLVYITPDIFNDFQMSSIRKSFKLYYSKSNPFPKSMGLIFNWQFSNRFSDKSFSSGDFVLVVDLIGDNLTFTLVQGIYNDKVNDYVAESRGIIWERHPTWYLDISEYTDAIKNIFIECGCNENDAPRIIDYLGIEGILKEKDLLTINNGNNWFHITPALCAKIEKKTLDIHTKISDYKLTRASLIGESNVHIISGTELFKLYTIDKYDSDNALLGYRKYERNQKQINTPLWSDHVPSLSIKYLYGKFNLLEDVSIEAQFNKIQKFEIKNSFPLFPDIKIFKFPLIIGDEVSDAQYEATLSSSAFPLKTSVDCKLTMTYEYGSEEPYNLIVEPVNNKNAGFSTVKAEWRKIKNYETEGLSYPRFPNNRSWYELQNFPRKFGDGTQDLLYWTSNILVNIFHLVPIYLRANNAFWKTGKNGKHYCYINQSGCKILIHENSFENKKDFSLDCDMIYCTIEANNQRAGEYVAKDIRITNDPYNSPLSKYYLKSLFAFHTVFQNNRKIADFECPKDYRNIINENHKKLVEGYFATNNIEIKNFCLSLMALMNVNFPIKSLEIANDYLSNYFNNDYFKLDLVMLSAGDQSTTEQKALFSRICEQFNSYDKISRNLIPALAVAIWKNSNLIFNIDTISIIGFFEISIDFIEYKANKLANQDKVYKKIFRTTRHLEFMLAVFRLREKDWSAINNELSLNNKLIKRAYNAVEKFTKIVIENDIELISRIEIQVEKPEQYKKIPNLLYSLLVYITGNNSVKDEIIISGVSSVDE